MKYICGLSIALLGISPLLIAGDYPGRDIVAPGTRIEVRTDNPVVVARWERGRIYPAHVARDVFSTHGDVMIPRGADCEMIVRELGPGQLTLDLESITVAGRRYVMDASGPQFNMNRDQYNNGAGVIGSIVGAIAGAAGADVQYQGDRVHVPAGAELTFQLQQPLHIATWRDEGYQDRGYHYHREENHGWYR